MTVLKQRCREHGITRWPYRKVKKLDTIINALGGDGAASADDADRRLATVKRTRESLITDPNSDAHLRVGKLKTMRRRLSTGSGNSGSGDDEGSFGSHGAVPSSGGNSFRDRGGVSRPRATRASSGSPGVDGLLEAAATLSDGETPGTPARDPDGIRDRSPRISGLLSAVENDLHQQQVQASDAAAALGALFRPSGSGGAFAPVKPSQQPLSSGPNDFPSAMQSVNHQAALSAALDPKAYAAALAAFAQGMSTAAAPPPPAAWMVAAAQAPSANTGQHVNPYALFAWMAAMSAAPPPPVQPPVAQWNADALQRLMETMRAAARVNANADADTNVTRGADEAPHQPL